MRWIMDQTSPGDSRQLVCQEALSQYESNLCVIQTDV